MQRSKSSALFLAYALAACGGGSSGAASQSVAKPITATGDRSCPVAIPGTSVSVEDASNGASLVFVTTGDVAEVRRRVAAMAAKHNEHHSAMGPLPDGSDTGGEHAGHDMSGHAGHDMSGHAGHDMAGPAGHDMAGPAGHDMSSATHAGHTRGMISVHSKALAGDVEGGAKVTFVATSADIAKLQSELRMHAPHFAAGACEMAKS